MKKVITYDELLDKIPNKYTLTITAGKRARDIGRGAPVLTKVSKKDTIVMKTFREILDDKVTFGEQREEDLNEQE
ncbi:DNA-directed RNA polymerase subunit omega [Cetobacterium sp. 8H]|uniref:DNA-directed RNA polymerase subunit omega n=1 Tax=Cetobacterium sp. 8H TaxID=2759681 RepID=UPI00163C9FFA|nr:DNA-directed RNA polymerase subunit omega [Cetobacterium sp. 8H]MBC2851028.1 DNA-directed RNA polymerase subunit omega [Cetobacterium sp. 8H]